MSPVRVRRRCEISRVIEVRVWGFVSSNLLNLGCCHRGNEAESTLAFLSGLRRASEHIQGSAHATTPTFQLPTLQLMIHRSQTRRDKTHLARATADTRRERNTSTSTATYGRLVIRRRHTTSHGRLARTAAGEIRRCCRQP